MNGDAGRPAGPDPDHDRHVAFPDLDESPRRTAPRDIVGRPPLSHTTAAPGRPIHRPATPVRPPGTRHRWGWWVAGAAALAMVIGDGGGVHLGLGGAEGSVSVAGAPGYGYDPGMDSGTDPHFGNDSWGDAGGHPVAAQPVEAAPASIGSWVELADAAPIGGPAPLTGSHRRVHPVPLDAQQLRVEVVAAGPTEATTTVTVDDSVVLDPLERPVPWVAEAPVDRASGSTAASTVQVEVQSPAGTGILECRIYAGGTLVALDTSDTAVTCTAPVPAPAAR